MWLQKSCSMIVRLLPVNFSIYNLFFNLSYVFSIVHLSPYNCFNSSVDAIYFGKFLNSISVVPFFSFTLTILTLSLFCFLANFFNSSLYLLILELFKFISNVLSFVFSLSICFCCFLNIFVFQCIKQYELRDSVFNMISVALQNLSQQVITLFMFILFFTSFKCLNANVISSTN